MQSFPQDSPQNVEFYIFRQHEMYVSDIKSNLKVELQLLNSCSVLHFGILVNIFLTKPDTRCDPIGPFPSSVIVINKKLLSL